MLGIVQTHYKMTAAALKSLQSIHKKRKQLDTTDRRMKHKSNNLDNYEQ